LNDRILALSKLAGQIRGEIQPARSSLPPSVFENLTHLESSLFNLSKQTSEFEEERGKLLALTDTTQAVNSTLELNDVLRIVMDTIVRLTKAERGFLMLRDAQGEMVTHIARNWEQESINSSEFAISRTVVEKVIESGSAILTTNAQEDPRFGNQESIVAYNLRSILCVPLKVKSELIGVLYADNRIRSGLFGESDRELLGAFANQAALAIENARLFASIRSTLAEVTKLKNLMDNIFSSIVSGVITADIEDQVTLCNRAAEFILGLASADIIGHPLSELMPSLGGDIESRFNDVIHNNMQVTDLEFSHNLPKRGQVDWRVNLSPLKDADQTTQGIAIVLDDLTERKHLEAQRRLLERMVSPAVINQINLDSLQIGGKHADITILFADIRGFTSFSEKQTPEELVAVLNHYLAAAAEAVLAEEGTVDKFLGDAVMAWFNAPLPQPDHTLRAVKAALCLRTAVQELHAKLPPEGRLSFGVGIHYGDVVLGLIGTEKRVEYTAIGDSVNTTKRIQENAAKDQILISREAYDKVKRQVEARPFGPLQVKGRSEPVEVYEVIGLKA
jgi:PAS domain S-box-containing protein